MAIRDLNSENAKYHREIIGELTPGSARLWGEMTVERMMRHVRASIEAPLEKGGVLVLMVAPPIRRNFIGWWFFDVMMTWPKGGMKALPAYHPPDVGAFQGEQRLLLAAVDRFVARCTAAPEERVVHPVLGNVPLRRWVHVHGVHMNHHYRQFGLV